MSETLYTTSTFTTFVTTATQNATVTEITGTVTQSLATTVNIVGSSGGILLIPIIVFGVLAIIVAFTRRKAA